MCKRIICFLLTIALLLGLAACSEGGGAEYTGPTREFTDSAGRTVTVPEQIDRVAVTGQLAQIMVFSAAPDKLIALASEWSADAEGYIDGKYYSLPVLGQLFGGNGELNLEEMLGAAPQVIIDMGERKESIAEDMDDIQNQTGIPTVHITVSMDDTAAAYAMLGELLGVQEKTAELAEYCTAA